MYYTDLNQNHARLTENEHIGKEILPALVQSYFRGLDFLAFVNFRPFTLNEMIFCRDGPVAVLPDIRPF